jgi:hypothetical protein
MHRSLLALTFVAAVTPALAQNVIGENPVLEGTTTCGQFAVMDSIGRQNALTGIEPLGGSLPGSDPELVRQWENAVSAACQGQPERRLSDAAAEALGGN